MSSSSLLKYWLPAKSRLWRISSSPARNNTLRRRASAPRREYRSITRQLEGTGRTGRPHPEHTGYARIDAFVRIYSDNSVEAIIIETNSLPSPDTTAILFQQAAINGYTPFEYLDKIITFGFERQVAKRPLAPTLPEKAPPVDPLRVPKAITVMPGTTERTARERRRLRKKALLPLKPQPFWQYLLNR